MAIHIVLPFFFAQKAGAGVPRARRMGHQSWGMPLLGVNDTKCFNEVQPLSPCDWQVGSTGKLECGHWPGRGVGRRETNLYKAAWRRSGVWASFFFFFFFFFFCCTVSWPTCLKWDCLVSSMVSMISKVNAPWPWQFRISSLKYPVYVLVVFQVVFFFLRTSIDFPKI